MAIPNPFNPREQGEMNMKRNAYDLSRTNLFTSHWGRVTPCFLQEVIPGDSFKLDNISLAVQGMPTVFPLQTRVRVAVEFYYGRNRCVFDGFEDFIFKTKDIEQPWLRLTQDRAKQMISTGSLGDMFGIPSTVGRAGISISRTLSFSNPVWVLNRPGGYISNSDYILSNFLYVGKKFYLPINNLGPSESLSYNDSAYFSYIYSNMLSEPIVFDDSSVDYIKIPFNSTTSLTYSSSSYPFVLSILDSESNVVFSAKTNYTIFQSYYGIVVPSSMKSFISSFEGSYRILVSYTVVDSGGSFDTGSFYDNDHFVWLGATLSSSSLYPLFTKGVLTTFIGNEIVDSTDDSVISSNPYIGGTPDIKINALPFRHYEQICNYYYRNDKNNPYYLNGEVQYNEFIPTHAAGADDNVYGYHYKNWELDRFTSALQSPQFGEAPLVGLTFTGDKTATLEFEQDGHTYTAEVGVDSNDVVETIQNFSQDIPSANLRKLQEMINYGISINDLRVTNSFQRFLENVMRRGLRYRNQLKSHFGVGVDYPDIDIPQYIGGFSGDLTVGKTTSMAQTSEASLGDFNGQLSGMLQAKHSIHCYCPEHGFIIGMVTITPVPVYTQTCNKVLIKQDPFDYYLPEFGKIGFVPMHYSEVMPLQTPVNGSVDDVFGYQKAHYDYMQAYDEAHSFFRTNLKDFVLQRTFAERPTLVEDFTVINPEHLSDVFITQNIADKYNVSDKFLCNFYAHVVAKRPIPRVGTPSLE